MPPAVSSPDWAAAKATVMSVLGGLTDLCDDFDALSDPDCMGELVDAVRQVLAAADSLAGLYNGDSRRAIMELAEDVKDRAHAFRGYVNTQGNRAGWEHFEGLPNVGRKLRRAVEAAVAHIGKLKPPTASAGLRIRDRDIVTVLIIDSQPGEENPGNDGKRQPA
jgi:hypothetical protein